MIIIRRAVYGDIIHLSSSSLDKNLLPTCARGIHSMQVNILATDKVAKPRIFYHSSKTTVFHFIVGSESHIGDLASKLLEELNIDVNADLLSKRELSVLQVLHNISTTKGAANELHISDRTLNNHRYNISKKTGMNALMAADLVYGTDNIRLALAILSQS